MSDVLTPERLDSYCGWCDGDRIAVSDGAPCLDSIHAAAAQLRAALAARDAQLAAGLAEALRAEGFVRGMARRYGRFNDIYWQQSAEVLIAHIAAAPVPPALDYETQVGRMADALHEDCLLELQAVAVVDPGRLVTQHGPDAHYGKAHDLVRRLARQP